MRIVTVVRIGAGLTLVALAGEQQFVAVSQADPRSPNLFPPLLPHPRNARCGRFSFSPGRPPTVPPPLETAVLRSEFESSQHTIWLVSLSDLQVPRTIAVIPHAPFRGISAALFTEGQQVAYVVLPSTTLEPERAADDRTEAWVQP